MTSRTLQTRLHMSPEAAWQRVCDPTETSRFLPGVTCLHSTGHHNGATRFHLTAQGILTRETILQSDPRRHLMILETAAATSSQAHKGATIQIHRRGRRESLVSWTLHEGHHVPVDHPDNILQTIQNTTQTLQTSTQTGLAWGWGA